MEGVERIVGILDGAVGRNLTSVETLDIANAIGAIVVSGNVRRSAQIALGKAWDEDYLQAKRWDLGTIPAWRAMSNNTVYLDHPDDLGPTFWRGYLGDGEPYGLYNLQASRAYGRTGEEAFDSTIEGVNPCGEIPLGHHESCNLAELVLPRFEDEGEMKDAAILLYKVQKAIAALPFSDEKTNEIAHSNMRLGLGVTGVAQAMERLPWLDRTYDYIKTYDAFWSGRRDMPESVRLTTVKPSGTLSLLAGVTPGAHPGFSRFHVRRIRMSTNDPVFAYAQKTGYPWEFVEDFEGNQDSRTAVVEFPCEFPEGTVLAEDLNAVQQLELQAVLQKTWADNAVSITIYYEREELEDIKAYLHSHWSDMKGVSFLLKTDHGFAQAPLEALTRDDYEVRAVGVHGHSYRVSSGLSDLLDGEECADGACPIR